MPDMIYWGLPAGIILLAVGGDMLVVGAGRIARRLGISTMLVGVTLVSFGTSMPELVTSIRAALLGSPGIAIGNVIGSNISNILLVLGAAAVISPLATPRNAIRRNGLVVILATTICIAIVYVGYLDRRIGIGLVTLLFLYFIYSYFSDGADGEEEGSPSETKGTPNLAFALLLTIAGMILVFYGARWLVDSSIAVARQYNVSETIIGLSIVALGTSLPELITSIMAAIRRETALALGNVLGSNIQNIFAILGITAIVHPIEVPAEIAMFDVWVMAGATLALIIFAATNRRLSRMEGLLFLIAYAAYIGYLAHLALGLV